MKKTTRFAGLAVALGLTSWLSFGHQAQALPQYALCRSVNGTSCSPSGSTKFCTWDRESGESALCNCEGTPLTWHCPQL